MSFSAAAQWLEDWQLRLLVLGSLFFQYFLFAAAIVRKLRVPHWFRALIWLAYQAGDVVAIYALATLLSQHKEEALAMNPESNHLDTLWAPVLLLHLGGQDGITAYSIEDNENWRRYLLLAVCQIAVAVYVFRKSWWSGDTVLLRAAILLFVPGILKCLEKPWALKNATVTSLINSSDSQLQQTLEEDDGLHKEIYSQEDYVQAAAKCVAEYKSKPLVLFGDEVADHPYHLLVDLGHPYAIRLKNLQLVAPRDARVDVHGLVRSWLSKAFNRLYTKHMASFGGLLRAAVVLLTFVDIGLFQRSHRGVYDRADVVVTYILLCCTAALELVSACLVLASGLPPPDDKMAQYNLVGYLARNEKHRRFWALVGFLGARLQLDRLWCTAAPEPSLGITRLVYDHVAGWWKDYISKSLNKYDGLGAYRRFNDSRGERTLEKEWLLGKEECGGRRAIDESLRMPFDESVLIWHLATEFCYFDHVDTGHDATRHSRMVSNYMAYLLFVEPEMLIPGARRKLFTATYLQLRKMLKPPPEKEEAVEIEPMEKKAPPPKAKNEMVRMVIQKVKTTIDPDSEDLVRKAWAVAHELMEFSNAKEMEFIEDQNAREKTRREVMGFLRCAKNKADEFIYVTNNRDKDLDKLMKVMDCAQLKADKFIGIINNKAEEAMEDKTLMTVMQEAKETAEWFIKQKQTMEEERITEFVRRAKNKAEEFIKNEQEKEKKVPTVEEFSKNAREVIKLAEEEKKKLMVGRAEVKKKVEDFFKQANEFINDEKKKNRTEEMKITELLESAMKKADEFVKNEKKMGEEPNCKPKAVEEETSVIAVMEFSKQAGEAITLVEEKDNKLTELMGSNLIANKQELMMIRAREHADNRMWAVIQGVWVEMLCFSAGRCRGYLHAKSLGNGGEYLSYVWLLLYYMGMETMPERMQRPQPPTNGDTGDVVNTPTDEEMEEEPLKVRRRRRSTAAPSPPASSRPGAAEPGARTAQAQQRLVVTPTPAMSSTAVAPVGDDMV